MHARGEGRPGAVGVRRIRLQDWQAWKQIRLEALEDTPIGFLELLADARAKSDEQWRERVEATASSEQSALFLAWRGEQVVGSAGGWWRDRGPYVVVYAVYVTPDARGATVLDQLLGAVERWAGTRDGVHELRLEVHEDNLRARAAYAKLGFVETGGAVPYPSDPSRRELEMARPL